MTRFMLLVPLLLTGFFITSCTPATNAYDKLYESCDVFAKDAEGFHFLKPLKKPLASGKRAEWQGIALHKDGVSNLLKISPKGCISVPLDDTSKPRPLNVTIRDRLSTSAKTISIAELDTDQLMTQIEMPSDTAEKQTLATFFSCDLQNFSTQRKIALNRQTQSVDRYALMMASWKISFLESQEIVAQDRFISNDQLQSDIDLASFNLPDGFYELTVENIDLFSSLSDEERQDQVNLESSCRFYLDRNKPKIDVNVDFSKQYAQDPVVIKLSPGQLITFSTNEDASVYYCLTQIEETQLDNWRSTPLQPENQNLCETFNRVDRSFISTPNEGIWRLTYFARDKAGNESTPVSTFFAVYHDRMIASVKEKIQIARLESMMQNDSAAIEAARSSIEQYNLLKLTGERKELEDALTKDFWQLDQNLKQKSSMIFPGPIRNMQASPTGQMFKMQIEAQETEEATLIFDSNFKLIRSFEGTGSSDFIDDDHWYYYDMKTNNLQIFRIEKLLSEHIIDSLPEGNASWKVSPNLAFLAVKTTKKIKIFSLDQMTPKSEFEKDLISGSFLPHPRFMPDSTQLFFHDLTGIFSVDLKTFDVAEIYTFSQNKKLLDLAPFIGENNEPFLLMTLKDLDSKDRQILQITEFVKSDIKSGLYRLDLSKVRAKSLPDEINHVFMGHDVNSEISQQYNYPGYFYFDNDSFKPYIMLNDGISDHFFVIEARSYNSIKAVDFRIVNDRRNRIQLDPIRNLVQIANQQLSVYTYGDNQKPTYVDPYDGSHLKESVILSEKSLHLFVDQKQPDQLVVRSINDSFLPEYHASFFRINDLNQFPIFEFDFNITIKDLHHPKNSLFAHISRHKSAVIIQNERGVEKDQIAHPKDEIVTAISWKANGTSLWFTTINKDASTKLYRYDLRNDMSTPGLLEVLPIGNYKITKLVDVENLSGNMLATELTDDQSSALLLLSAQGRVTNIPSEDLIKAPQFQKVDEERICAASLADNGNETKNWIRCWQAQQLENDDYTPSVRLDVDEQKSIKIDQWSKRASVCGIQDCEIFDLKIGNEIKFFASTKNLQSAMASSSGSTLTLDENYTLKVMPTINQERQPNSDSSQAGSGAKQFSNIADYGFINEQMAWASTFDSSLLIISLSQGEPLAEYEHPLLQNSLIQDVVWDANSASLKLMATHWISNIFTKTIFLDPISNLKAMDQWLNEIKLEPEIVNGSF